MEVHLKKLEIEIRKLEIRKKLEKRSGVTNFPFQRQRCSEFSLFFERQFLNNLQHSLSCQFHEYSFIY